MSFFQNIFKEGRLFMAKLASLHKFEEYDSIQIHLDCALLMHEFKSNYK